MFQDTDLSPPQGDVSKASPQGVLPHFLPVVSNAWMNDVILHLSTIDPDVRLVVELLDNINKDDHILDRVGNEAPSSAYHLWASLRPQEVMSYLFGKLSTI